MILTALLILLAICFLAYRVLKSRTKAQELKEVQQQKEEEDEATYAAIGLAIHKYLNDTVHDYESYKITIKRK